MRISSHTSSAFKTKSRNKAFLGLWASGFCYFAALGFILPVLPLLLQMSALTYTEIGIIYMIGLVFPVLLQTLWGTLADRIGREPIIVVTTIIIGITSALYPNASSFKQFLLLGILWNTCLAAATTVTPALAVDIAGPVTAGRGFGRYRISGSIGWVTSTATSGLIAGNLGIKTVFYLAAILYLLSAVFIRIFVRDQPSIRNEISRNSSLRRLTRNKNLVVFLSTIFMVNISATAFQSFLSLYIRNLGGSDTIIGWSFSIAAVAEVPCMIYLGALSDRVGRKPMLVAALLVYPLRLFLYTVVGQAYLILPIQLLHGFTFGVLYVASIAFVSDMTPAGRGIALGLHNTAYYGGSAAGSILAGIISDSQGLINMYRFMAVFSFIPALFFTLIAKESLRKH